MLGACLPHETELAVRESVMPTISSFEEARRFSRVAVRFKRVVPFHLKIDTGMGRLGVVADQALNLIQSIRKLSGLNCVGLYTHFASAEDDAEFCASQRQQFQSIVESTLAPLPGVQYIHAHNSAGLLFERPSVFNCVRPGLLVYGILPEARRKLPVLWRRRIRPALSWKTRVGLIKEIAGGSSISYGRTFVAARAMRIAIITAGYGDGYLRSGSNRAQVLVRGHRCPVLGRITMDQMVVDVSHLPRVRVGDEVVLLGKQGREEISAVELAVWQSTIPWEVLTNITYRVPRLYRGAQAA
jgi:alanine racemase